jgi:hypothetical protein
MTDTKDLYVKADLEDHADFDRIEDAPRIRAKILREALDIEPDDLHMNRCGSYQGSMLFVFELNGQIWLLADSFGSCEVCDGLLAADHVREYATRMCRDSYAFETKEDAVSFLYSRECDRSDSPVLLGTEWRAHTDEGIEILEENF